MRAPRLVRAFILFAALATLALASLAQASAAPAETTNYRNCSPDVDGNTICFTIHDVEKFRGPVDEYGAPDREVGSMLIEYFDANGNLLWSDKTRWNSFIIEKDGEWQVYHQQTKATFEVDGESCTAVHNVNYANGETRNLGPEWEWNCK